MKKISFIISFFLIFVSLFSCTENKISLNKEEHIMDVMIASDLHYLSDDLFSLDNKIYTKANLTSDGRYQEKDNQIIDMLIDKVKKESPQYLVLTGDLSFNGEKKSHLALKDKLSELLDKTKVLVIPGNHDTFYNSKSYINDEVHSCDTITIDEFKDIYKEFGYSNALYKDEVSASYVYPLSDNYWAFMLDTTLNRYNYYYGELITGGEIEASTISWMEDIFKKAKDNNIKVLSFTHHNLLTHNPLFETFYTLRNADEIINLYQKYNVLLNFSGHLHIQSIKNKDKFYDISSVSLLDYGNRVGKLEIYQDGYFYHADKVSNEKDFIEASFSCFYNKYYQKIINSNLEKYGNDAIKVSDLLSKYNTYYFDGDYESIYELKRKNRSLMSIIRRKEGEYFKIIDNLENVNQHELTIVV